MAGYPTGTSTFVPQFDASGQLVVAFARNPKDFPLNQYITITPVKKGQGYYLNITAEQAARLLNSDGSENVWNDGNDAPDMSWGNESFNFVKYETIRFAYGFRMGWKAVEQADWKIMASHAAMAAQRAMTYRTLASVTALTTSGNYGAGHVDTATNFGGGLWTAGSETNPYIKASIEALARQIQIDTLGVVGMKDLVLVVNPRLASKMSQSAEIHSYLARSPYAYPYLKGEGGEYNARWGLPDNLYGVKVVVEDAVQVTSVKGATRAASYVLPPSSGTAEQALLIARPGSLTSAEGAVSFSTGHIFSYEEMKVETKDDPDNRRTLGRVVDDFTFQVVAPASGGIITACTS